MPWDPAQYLKFAGHRLRPAIDLLNRIDATDPGVVYDLGAGAGNVTRLIKDRWPSAQVIGVDSSEDMLAKARAAAPDIVWQLADLGAWSPALPADVIFSNAALQWLDHHDRLFPALMTRVAPGGVLAVQMPRNFGAPSHTAITETALDGPWRATLEPMLRPTPVAEPSFYFDLLAPHAAEIDMWETEYVQVLEGAHPVKEWVKGTWLAPILAALDEPDRARFESQYSERADRLYPRRADGRTLFPFRRLFIVATAPR